ncbi:conserved hypothetical protein [Desulfamplus magnetovallimortis]|uniref:Uncharacterized protein n=1 Tax=Desulfamplus magnetovallimortis TaxID=1246637 RepID=A0A1W1HIP2_9BACT|nr:hypothetical protein [Desulfamplus magnetovallimortis]SLM32349.1 conserved hypothetical protein [Desulfamplus magnetovallimortis]
MLKLNAQTRQKILTPTIHKLSEKEAEFQHKDFNERIKRLRNSSFEELEKVLQERESVKPEAILRLESRIVEARKDS